MKNYCRNCDGEMEPDAKFCTTCGKNLPSLITVPIMAKKRFNFLYLMIPIAAILLIAAQYGNLKHKAGKPTANSECVTDSLGKEVYTAGTCFLYQITVPDSLTNDKAKKIISDAEEEMHKLVQFPDIRIIKNGNSYYLRICISSLKDIKKSIEWSHRKNEPLVLLQNLTFDGPINFKFDGFIFRIIFENPSQRYIAINTIQGKLNNIRIQKISENSLDVWVQATRNDESYKIKNEIESLLSSENIGFAIDSICQTGNLVLFKSDKSF